jgi:hypothetical protein
MIEQLSTNMLAIQNLGMDTLHLGWLAMQFVAATWVVAILYSLAELYLPLDRFN